MCWVALTSLALGSSAQAVSSCSMRFVMADEFSFPSSACVLVSVLRRMRTRRGGLDGSVVCFAWEGRVGPFFVRAQGNFQKLIAAGPRMTRKSTGKKKIIIGTVSFGGRAAAFFSASLMRMSRFSLAIVLSAWLTGVP